MLVSFLDEVHPVLWQRLTDAGFECADHSLIEAEDLSEALHNVHGIVIRSRFPMNESILKFAPHLNFIARSGAGMENIDEAYCEQRQIVLFNAPEGNSNAVAEQALCMLLSLMNNVVTADNEVRSGIWDREGNRGEELDGKTVGIIGYGNNGSAFIRKMAGFDVNILAYDKYKFDYGTIRVRESSMNDIFRHADVVSLHIPQNLETMWLVDYGFFQSFYKPIWFLNLARGKLVRISDLLKAIDSGIVKGAGLDVLEFESSSFENWLSPEQNNPVLQSLLQNKKVILTPHVGGWTKQSYYKLSNVLADKILEYYSKR